MLIPSWFWMIYHLLFVVECRSLCCHGNSIEFIGPFIQNDFPDFISWWIMWLLLPSTKQFLKSFILQRAQTLRWWFSFFLKHKWVPDAPGDPPSPPCPGCSAPLHFRTNWMSKIAMQAEKLVLIEEKVIAVTGKREVVWKYLFYGWGQTVLPVFGPQSQLRTCPLKVQEREWERKTKCFAIPIG